MALCCEVDLNDHFTAAGYGRGDYRKHWRSGKIIQGDCNARTKDPEVDCNAQEGCPVRSWIPTGSQWIKIGITGSILATRSLPRIKEKKETSPLFSHSLGHGAKEQSRMNTQHNATNRELKNRYDFVFLYDVTDGNPNGNPEAGNQPRTDPETNHALVSDVCFKRKIRNYISLMRQEQPGFEIYVKDKAVLAHQNKRAYTALGLENPLPEEETPEENGTSRRGKKAGGPKMAPQDVADKARDWMCKTFYDVRCFGAVMSLKESNAGQVRGPVQICFSRSIDPVLIQQHRITRQAVATTRESNEQQGGNRTMGQKSTVPYALFLGYGFVSPQLALQTGFGEDDLGLLWEAICNMWDHDRSASRGLMSLRRLWVFKHASVLGNAPSIDLIESIKVSLKIENTPPRCFDDYSVTFNRHLPPGIEVMTFPQGSR